MIKIASVTPINCITHEQDDQTFEVHWNQEDGVLSAILEDGTAETLDHSAETLKDAIKLVHSLYVRSIAYICEMEEFDDET